ncbi:hypothetical protein BD770DRAFT_382045 [Pilaira anomala]|nr:hypothetical protein BD770DRAFT_382045 [Pilaira anomala]
MSTTEIETKLQNNQDEVNSTYCLSSNVIESLESVKQIGLNVLDLLLLKLVKETPRKQQQRRLSDCTLVDSTLQDDTLMKRSLSSPVTNHQLNQVYQLLDTHHEQMNQQDYTLCCSLAALLTNIYQLLELPTESTLEQLTDFELQRTTQGIMSLNDEPDIQTIWNELDHLMTIVRESLLLNPPTYDQTTTAQDPPSYHSLLSITKENGTEVERQDLNVLLEAIDRLTRVAPQLDNQRVQLNPTQVKELAAATLGKTVERLSKGRLESQRASLPIIKTKQHVLLDLIEQIERSASRSLDNQRVSLNIKQQRQLDIGSLFHVLDKLDKGRFTNQEWLSHEQLLIKELKDTTDLLVKSMDRPAYNRQRYSFSPEKERNLYLSGLCHQVERLENYRLVNQDAELPLPKDLDHLLNNIYQPLSKNA